MITPSGRFKTDTRLCLSMSDCKRIFFLHFFIDPENSCVIFAKLTALLNIFSPPRPLESKLDTLKVSHNWELFSRSGVDLTVLCFNSLLYGILFALVRVRHTLVSKLYDANVGATCSLTTKNWSGRLTPMTRRSECMRANLWPLTRAVPPSWSCSPNTRK